MMKKMRREALYKAGRIRFQALMKAPYNRNPLGAIAYLHSCNWPPFD